MIELSLASEALGLVSSLDWHIEAGPNRHELKSREDNDEDDSTNEATVVVENSDDEELEIVRDEIEGRPSRLSLTRKDVYKRDNPFKKSRDG